eukprot:5511186-Amphidinium_carterae.1
MLLPLPAEETLDQASPTHPPPPTLESSWNRHNVLALWRNWPDQSHVLCTSLPLFGRILLALHCFTARRLHCDLADRGLHGFAANANKIKPRLMSLDS